MNNPTIIAKRIKSLNTGNNFDRANALADYISRIESAYGDPKCVKIALHGFSGDSSDMTLEDIKKEFLDDLYKAKTQKKSSELISHWILSFANGNTPSDNDIIKASDIFMMDMGYDLSYKYIIAIHADTNHKHAHIMASRVDPDTGKLIKEGGGYNYKAAQRAIARIAYEMGWRLEAGTKYRVRTNPEMETIRHDGKLTKRPRVSRRLFDFDPKNMRARALNQAAYNFEQKTGLKSQQRILQENLSVIFRENDLKAMKTGHFHKILAEKGIACQKAVEDGKEYLKFSRDGKMWFYGGALFHGLNYKNLTDALGGGWRDARPAVTEMLAQKWAEQVTQFPPVMPGILNKIRFTGKALETLSRIPLDKIQASLPASYQGKADKARGDGLGDPFTFCAQVCGTNILETLEILACSFPAALAGSAQVLKVGGYTAQMAFHLTNYLSRSPQARPHIPLSPPKTLQPVEIRPDEDAAQNALPPSLSKAAIAEQTRLLTRRGSKADRSKIDLAMGKFLHGKGATRKQIYSFFLQHMAQRKRTVTAVSREARRIAYRVGVVGELERPNKWTPRHQSKRRFTPVIPPYLDEPQFLGISDHLQRSQLELRGDYQPNDQIGGMPDFIDPQPIPDDPDLFETVLETERPGM